MCATMDFNIIRCPLKKFFKNGALRIQCSICVENPKSKSSSLKPSKEDFNKLKALLQKHSKNTEKAGVLTTKGVFTWSILESIMKTEKEEARSESFNFASSELFFKKLKGRKAVCLNQTTPVFLKQNIRVTLSVLDNIGIGYCAKEEVTQDSSDMLLNYGEVFKRRGRFLDDKGQLKISYVIQIDDTLETSGSLMPNPGGSSETSKLTTISSPTLKAAAVQTNSYDSSPSPGNKLFLKSVRNCAQKLVVKNSTFVSSKAEEKSEIEEAVKEMLQLLQEERMDTMIIVYKKDEPKLVKTFNLKTRVPA